MGDSRSGDEGLKAERANRGSKRCSQDIADGSGGLPQKRPLPQKADRCLKTSAWAQSETIVVTARRPTR